MLTVMREMATRVASELAHMPDDAPRRRGRPRRPEPPASPTCSSGPLAAGEASVRRGPDLLPVLREAGVVDAGGYGVIVIFAGVVAALRGDRAAGARAPRARPGSRHPEHASSTFRYCTNFAVTGQRPRRARVRRPRSRRSATRSSSSATAATLKVHVHTDDPERGDRRSSTAAARSRASTSPTCTSRSPQRTARLAATGPAGAALRGARRRRRAPGLRELFAVARRPRPRRRADAQPVDLRAARRHPRGARRGGRRPAEQRRTCVMAAERAAELAEKDVVVVPTRSQQAGLAAAVVLAPDRDGGRERRGDGATSLAALRTGGVAPAARADAAGRFVRRRRGRLRRRRDRRLGRARADARRGARGRSATTPSSSRSSPATARRSTATRIEALAPDGVELELSDGGQPGWWWLLSAECIEHPSVPTRAFAEHRRARPGHARRGARCTGRARRGSATTSTGSASSPRPRRPRRSGSRRSASCSSTCRATRARRARSASSRSTRRRPSSSRSAPSRRRPVRRRGMKPLVEATVADATGVMKATFFNQPWLAQPVQARHAADARRQVPGPQPLPGQHPRAHRGGRRRWATRSPSTRRRRASRRRRSSPACASTGPRSATRSSRCPPRSAWPSGCPTAAGRDLGRALRRPRGRPTAARVRRAAARPDRPAPPAARAARRAARGAARRPADALTAVARGAAAVHADERPGQRDGGGRRGPRLRAPDGSAC